MTARLGFCRSPKITLNVTACFFHSLFYQLSLFNKISLIYRLGLLHFLSLQLHGFAVLISQRLSRHGRQRLLPHECPTTP